MDNPSGCWSSNSTRFATDVAHGERTSKAVSLFIMFEWPFILDFWFGPLDEEGVPDKSYRQQWFTPSRRFDWGMRRRFSSMVLLASEESLDQWRREPGGALAEILLLDQFSRNIYRGTAMAFRNDPLAQRLAREGVEQGRDTRLPLIQRAFFYMPYQHAENRGMQEEGVALYEQLVRTASGRLRDVLDSFYQSAGRHRAIIDRFGRFPHRNGILRRATTEAEQRWLEDSAHQYSCPQFP